MKNKFATKDIVLMGMFAAIISVMSQISIPLPTGVPITMQTFAIALTGCVLGMKLGTISTVVWILLGTVGVPVFSNFTAGPSKLVGKTGGFMFGFIIMVALCGIGAKNKKRIVGIALMLLGLIVAHVFGIIQFMILTRMGFVEAALLVSLPYAIKDIVSVVLGYVMGKAISERLVKANILEYRFTNDDIKERIKESN